MRITENSIAFGMFLLHNFEGEQDCAAWLIAWRVDGACTSGREEHTFFYPSQEQIERAARIEKEAMEE